MMTATEARKHRERAAREELIVAQAERLLLRDGFQDLNLDELARRIEYSKGTIYLHFETKEDLALAVVTKAVRERADLLERAAKFAGTTRERMRALSCATCQFAVDHPDHFTLEMTLKGRSFWERASEERRRLQLVQTSRIFQTLNNIVVEAGICGDLPSEARLRDVTMSLIAVTIGTDCAFSQPDINVLCGIEDPLAALQMHHDLVLDGWNWTPLSQQLDRAQVDRRIRTEMFPEATWMKS